MVNRSRLRACSSVASILCFGTLSASHVWAEEPHEFSLKFDRKDYTKEVIKDHGETIRIRTYKYLVYVKHPVDVNYQYMNVYVPEAYYNGDSINGYTAETAPIFFPNAVGGYMQAEPASPEEKQWDFSDRSGKGGRGGPPPGGGGGHGGGSFGVGGGNGGLSVSGGMSFGSGSGGGGGPSGGGGEFGGGPGGGGPRGGNPPGGRPAMGMPEMEHQNAVFEALAHGYVVASPGVRGRTLKNEEGENYGKAPACIVDLKAAVRYLRLNDKYMHGDANKIISNGTSAGGALSALLGATGNNPDYEPYLQELGAADASDAVFAASCYCPITDLEHADLAYEWLFSGETKYRNQGEVEKLSRKEKKVARALAPLFPGYLNSLNLTAPDGSQLTLKEHGEGSFKEYLKKCILASAQYALDHGADLSHEKWIQVKLGKAVDMNWDEFIHFVGRMKTPPAFDSLDMTSAENSLFGTNSVDSQHFTTLGDKYRKDHSMADAKIVELMNPLGYIGKPGTLNATHWRIRHGTLDRDIAYAVPLILATKLQNNGADVDIAYAWGRPHSGDYDLEELFTWIDSICRK